MAAPAAPRIPNARAMAANPPSTTRRRLYSASRNGIETTPPTISSKELSLAAAVEPDCRYVTKAIEYARPPIPTATAVYPANRSKSSDGVGIRAPLSSGVWRKPTEAGGSEVAPEIPQLRIKALVEGGPQIGSAGRAAGPGLGPDLAFHHQHMPEAPLCEELVVIDQRLRREEQVGVRVLVAHHQEQAVPAGVLVVRRHGQ